MEKRASKSRKVRREKQRVAQHAKSRTYVTAASAAAQLDAENSQFENIADQGPIDPFDVEKL